MRVGFSPRRLTLAALVCAFAFIFIACGHGRKAAPVPELSPEPVTAQQGVPLEATLVELNALIPPEGVDAALFQQLKSQLAQKLKACGMNRVVSTPPTGDGNRVDDLAAADNGDGSFTLSWHYRNLGDYDQNGTAAIADITPIAVHFGEDVPADGENTLQAVVDGSGSAKVDIADITPLAQNFGVSVSEYRIEGAAAEMGSYSTVSTTPASAGTGEGRLAFTSIVDQPEHVYYHVVPCDASGTPGIASTAVRRPGDAPEVVSVTPTEGAAGSVVTFSAEISGEEPTGYMWSFGGGADPNSSTLEEPEVTLGAAGEYECSLFVSSSFGNDTFDFVLDVNGIAPSITSVSPVSGCEGRNVTFTAEVEGTEPLVYSWDFGGGASPNTSSGASPNAVLGVSGEYNATLEVSNDWGEDTEEFTLTVSTADYDWNFAVYMGADNNLAGGIWADVQQLEHVGSSPEVAVNLQGEFYYPWGFQWPNVERVYVVQDFDDEGINNTGHPANMSFDRIGFDSASPQAISDYLNWSTQNFIASKNLIVLSDHGAGWYNGHNVSGIISDDCADTLLADHAIAQAMADTGVHFDVVMFDACDMSALEVAYEYRNVADYAVCSECVLPVKGEYYAPALIQLEADPSMQGGELAELLANELINYYTAHPEDIIDVSAISVLDLHAVDACITVLNAFTDEVLSRFATEHEAVTNAFDTTLRNETARVDGDIVDFLELYYEGTTSPEVQARIDDLLVALGNLVISNDAVWVEGDYSRLHGLTIWMPDQIGYAIYMADYRDPSFYAVTSWAELLDRIIGYQGTKVLGGLRFEITWDTDANVDLRVNEPDPWDDEGYRWNAPWEDYSYNGFFSGESFDTGESYEWWESWDWVMPGNYTFAAEYYVNGPTSDHANVTLKVWEDGVLIRDESVFMDYDNPWDSQYGSGWRCLPVVVK